MHPGPGVGGGLLGRPHHDRRVQVIFEGHDSDDALKVKVIEDPIMIAEFR